MGSFLIIIEKYDNIKLLNHYGGIMKNYKLMLVSLLCVGAFTACDKPEDDLKRDISTTIYLAGDSTVKTYVDKQYIAGWGQYLSYFLNDSVTVKNAANGGRSSRSFINEGRLYNISDSSFNYTFTENGGQSIESCIKEGDFLFIQFGHNDDNTKLSSSYTTIYDRMVPLGTPDENGIYPTTEGARTTTSSLPEVYTSLANASEQTTALSTIAKYGSSYYAYDSGGTYKWFLKQYIDFAREKGATPVLITPVARVKYDSEGNIIGGAGLHGDNFAYVQAVRQLAQEQNCLLIDLFNESKTMLEIATPTYGNYLMALKPNSLEGVWPNDYDTSYGNTSSGYTGVEATHYNKYGAFLQAGKIAETILNSKEVVNEDEYFSFSELVLKTPTSYVNPSNLMSKSYVTKLEELFTTVNVTCPSRSYPDPQEVIDSINELQAKGQVTNDNYIEIGTLCESIRALYNGLNVDDRGSVINLSVLSDYETSVEQFVEANRPKPIQTIVFDPSGMTTGSYTEAVTYEGFTVVGAASKGFDVISYQTNFEFNGTSYTTSKYIKLGGSATFGSSRYISFEVNGKCTITVVGKSSGSSDRIIKMVDSSNAQVGSFDAKTALSITSIDIESAGTYSVGSASSGVYVYAIIIDYYA